PLKDGSTRYTSSLSSIQSSTNQISQEKQWISSQVKIKDGWRNQQFHDGMDDSCINNVLLPHNWQPYLSWYTKAHSSYPCHNHSLSPPSKTHLNPPWRSLFFLPRLAFHLQTLPLCLQQRSSLH
ncbi:hypothetical protein RYX36_001810, partial [Vicia faba]